MDSGRCRRCGRAFTAGEITGFGILRTRPAARGGPIIEFPCPGCRTTLSLVPHGGGRFAFPGQPPPPPPTEEERAIPWRRSDGAESVAPRPGRVPHGPAPAPAPSEQAPSPPPPPSTPRPAPPPPRAEEGPAAEVPLTPLSAFDLLGLPPTCAATEVEAAFRERALRVHPDKFAHLDAEFIALADRRFRRLQQARELALALVDRRDAPSGG